MSDKPNQATEASQVEQTSSLPCKLRVLARDINGFVADALEEFDISPPQADFLYHLSIGDTSPSEISRRIGVDPSNLSRMIRQFEEKGWVVRHVDDCNRTRVNLELTKAGRKIIERIDPHAAHVQSTLEAQMSPAELARLHRLLNKVGAAILAGDPRGWLE